EPRPRGGEAAAALQELQGRRERRRRRQAVPVRLRVIPAREALQREVREERLAGGQVPAELEMAVQRGPELRREPDRRPAHGSGEGGGAVDQGEPRRRQAVA